MDEARCEEHDLPVDHDKDCYIEFLELNLTLYDITMKVLIERAGGEIIIDARETEPFLDDNKVSVPFPVDKTNEVVWKIQEVDIEDDYGQADDEMRS